MYLISNDDMSKGMCNYIMSNGMYGFNLKSSKFSSPRNYLSKFYLSILNIMCMLGQKKLVICFSGTFF